MKLLVVTNAPTLKENGKLVAYAPYVKEMDIWFRNVEEVGILSPTKYPESIFTMQFDFQQVKCFKLPFLAFTSLVNTLFSFLLSPFILIQFFRAFFWADHFHLRCPGNVGLIGCFVQVLFPKKPKTAKFAGNWDPVAKQPWTYRLQKWILSNTFLTRNMQVLVYGEWPGQSKNIIPFFTATFSELEKAEVRDKTFSGPYTFLFVGNLVEGKRPLEAVMLIEMINSATVQGSEPKISANLEIYGDGPEREKLETYVRENHLNLVVDLKGSRPLEELKDAYQKAHFVILPSRSEGWPKALAEGMFFGCIPISTPVSCVPWMLGYGSRGFLLGDNQKSRSKNQEGEKEWSTGDGQWVEDIKRLKELLAEPGRIKFMSNEAKQWSQQYTLEKFEEGIKQFLKESKGKFSSLERGEGEG